MGVRVCHNASSINHLLFADDSLLLFKKMEVGVQTICKIFSVSGLLRADHKQGQVIHHV